MPIGLEEEGLVVPTDFVIVRHGQTDWNLEKKIQGSTDIPLNATGEAQAQHTRDALRAQSIDAVVSSTLQRAAFTADAINEHHAKPRHIDPRLSERAFASVEGWTVDQVTAAFGSFDAIADVEPWDHVSSRMFDAMQDLAAAYPDGRLLVVTHGSSIRALLAHMQGLGPREVPSMWNCSISEVRHHDDGTWELLSFNDNSHLPEALRT